MRARCFGGARPGDLIKRVLLFCCLVRNRWWRNYFAHFLPPLSHTEICSWLQTLEEPSCMSIIWQGKLVLKVFWVFDTSTPPSPTPWVVCACLVICINITDLSHLMYFKNFLVWLLYLEVFIFLSFPFLPQIQCFTKCSRWKPLSHLYQME